jgi:DNA-directed RNA polymerase specialized sigma24 family protein
MDPNTGEDLLLARRAADGDERALCQLYERFTDALFAFIYHHFNALRPDAEEVWQETRN